MSATFRTIVAASVFAVSCTAESVPDTAAHTESDEHPSVVTLSAEAIRRTGITVAPVTAEAAGTLAAEQALEVPGHVEADPRRIGVVTARSDGRLERLLAVEGDVVPAGGAVAELFSPSYQLAQSDFVSAVRRRALVRHTADSVPAAQLEAAAAQRLVVLGANDADVDALRRGDPPRGTQVLRAPIGGSVIASHVSAGGALTAGGAVATLADLTELDVVADIPEISLAAVRIGQRATISVTAFPALRFRGTIERIRDVLDPETRTVRAILHVVNDTRVLRPGMYASVQIAVAPRGSDGRGKAVRIPSSAVVLDGAESIIFVETAAGTFARRVVQVESLSPPGSTRAVGDAVLVRTGVMVGERIVTRGAFVLKSELGKAALAEH
ncbi:MAG: efflux RND transporter periplasmic adaptor subunit [Gemmatimonadaceae bacterium]|nr:efflux RND transporter periplasmic adaptor subunit [Gemmatimonadaceae bacterium]